MPADRTSPFFTYKIFLLLLIFVLGFELKWKEPDQFRQRFEFDLRLCPQCFREQSEECEKFFQTIEYDDQSIVYNIVNHLLDLISSGKRSIYVMRRKNDRNKKIIAKYYASHRQLEMLRNSSLSLESSKRIFLEDDHLNGFQLQPQMSIDDFARHFEMDERLVWLYAQINVQAILMPRLFVEGFAVPRTYATCGFAQFQEHVGNALSRYYREDFVLKLQIAKQLLDLVQKFTTGFEGFRMYITDLTAENLVYDTTSGRLYIVDLDTVLMVNSHSPEVRGMATFKHEPMPCDGCFAFSPVDLSKHSISDMNIYAACRLLRENLSSDRSKGFLYPIPETIRSIYPDFEELLDACVDCVDGRCASRFEAADKLQLKIELILFDYNVIA